MRAKRCPIRSAGFKVLQVQVLVLYTASAPALCGPGKFGLARHPLSTHVPNSTVIPTCRPWRRPVAVIGCLLAHGALLVEGLSRPNGCLPQFRFAPLFAILQQATAQSRQQFYVLKMCMESLHTVAVPRPSIALTTAGLGTINATAATKTDVPRKQPHTA